MLEVLIVIFTFIRYHLRIFYLADEIKFNKHHNHEREVKNPTHEHPKSLCHRGKVFKLKSRLTISLFLNQFITSCKGYEYSNNSSNILTYVSNAFKEETKVPSETFMGKDMMTGDVIVDMFGEFNSNSVETEL